eukprot:11972091-Alexandrium_andersonii.AAC.1
MLTPDEHEQVRLGTYFALQSIRLAKECVHLGVGFAIDNSEPFRVLGQLPACSLFYLREMVHLSLVPGVRVVNFDQCQHGADTVKPTRLIYFGVDFS